MLPHECLPSTILRFSQCHWQPSRKEHLSQAMELACGDICICGVLPKLGQVHLWVFPSVLWWRENITCDVICPDPAQRFDFTASFYKALWFDFRLHVVFAFSAYRRYCHLNCVSEYWIFLLVKHKILLINKTLIFPELHFLNAVFSIFWCSVSWMITSVVSVFMVIVTTSLLGRS